ncbi:class I SAM-dependent methyltransferase, partial [bacterium]|nr:class I SAM-dependent methyltransferase [bacterium]
GIESGLMDFSKFYAIRLDYSFNTLLKAKEISPDINVVNANAYYLPFLDNALDVIVSQNVLEHMEYDEKVIDEIHRVLKKGGAAVLSVPAGLTTELTAKEKEGAPDHFRKYTKEHFEKIIKGRFVIQKIYFSQKIINTLWHKCIKILALSHSVYKRIIRIKSGSCYYDWWLYKLLLPLIENIFWHLDRLFAHKENNIMTRLAENYSICIVLVRQ